MFVFAPVAALAAFTRELVAMVHTPSPAPAPDSVSVSCLLYLTRFDLVPPYHLIGFPRPWRLGASAVTRYGSVLRSLSPIRGSFQRRQLPLGRIASGSPRILSYAARTDQNWRTVRSAKTPRGRGMLLAFPAQAAGPAASVSRQSCRQASSPDSATIGRGDLKVSIQASNLRAAGAVRMSTGCRGERLPLRAETDRQFSVRHTVAASPELDKRP